MSTYHHALRPGTQIANFKISRILGVGGFGITYQALDQNLDREVAIKEYFPSSLALRDDDGLAIKARSGDDQEQYQYGLDRFLDEGKTLAKFRQPNIVRVTQFLQENNTAYLIMDFEEGEPLNRQLKKQVTLEERQIIDIVMPLLEGLKVVHEMQFLHRDIKPANIFICKDGRPVLLDFGSARQAVQDREMTAIVTPGYAPYEQYFKKQKQGPWTDLYAVGATMFYCLTGIKPTPALDRAGEIKKGHKDPVYALLEHGAGKASDEFKQIILNLMQREPEERPQSATEVLEEMQLCNQALGEAPEIEWDDDFLAAVEQVLRDKQVANAHDVVDKASKSAHNAEEIADLLAGQLATEQDKTELMEKTVLFANQPADEQTSFVDPDASLPLYEILRRTRVLLATMIGPDAENWVASVAREAETREDFYRQLLEKLGDESLRKEFQAGVNEFDSKAFVD